MKRIAFAVLMLAAAMQAALAGDGSRIGWVGFSPDGRYFAFEQNGESDAAGDYASTSVIDVARNRHAKGSPLTWGPDDADEKKRGRVTAQVRALLKKTNISKQGFMTAPVPQARSRDLFSGIHVEPIQKAATESFALPVDWFGPDARLVLRELAITNEDCKVHDKTIGFSLVLERKGHTRTLWQDQSIPASRGCPFRYGIAEAEALRRRDGSVALAVMIQEFTPGFEGANRRFNVVTAQIPSRTRSE